MKTDKKIVSVELSISTIEQLQQLAKNNYRSLSAQLRMIIEKYVDENEVICEVLKN